MMTPKELHDYKLASYSGMIDIVRGRIRHAIMSATSDGWDGSTFLKIVISHSAHSLRSSDMQKRLKKGTVGGIAFQIEGELRATGWPDVCVMAKLSWWMIDVRYYVRLKLPESRYKNDISGRYP